MRKHFTPYRPVMRRIWPHVKPVADIFLLKNEIHPFIIWFADIVFTCSENNTHLPEIGVVVCRDIIYRIIKVNGIVIIAICKLLDIECTAHGETIAGQFRMPESSIHCMIATKTATGKCHSFKPCLMLGPGNKFRCDHPVKSLLVISPGVGRNGFIIPALRINAVRTINFYPSIFKKPFGGFDHSLILILIVSALRGWKQNDRLAAVPEYKHFDIAVKGRGMPFIIFFLHIQANFDGEYPNLFLKQQTNKSFIHRWAGIFVPVGRRLPVPPADISTHFTIFETMKTGKTKTVLKESIIIDSPPLERDVKVDIYLPAQLSAPGSMSLLLINDGQDMEKLGLEAILEGLYENDEIASVLCVGIHAGSGRKMEYGTASMADFKGRGARASNYSRFIFDTLIPYIRRQYARQGFKEKAFAGFSLGGLSALDIVWNHPHEFSKVGVFSGSFWWRTKDKGDDTYDDSTDRIIHQEIRKGNYYPWLKFFFECGAADEEDDRNNNGIIDSIDDTLDLIKELSAKGYDTNNDIHYLQLDDGRHDIDTWARSMPVFLKWAFGLSKSISNSNLHVPA